MEKYSFAAGGGVHEAHLMHRGRVLDGFWPDHFNLRMPDQQHTPAACLWKMTP